MVITIQPDGTVRHVDQRLSLRGDFSKTRQSRVVPTNRLLAVLFRVIRATVSDDSACAEWTRTWRCRWSAWIIDGPYLGEFDCRREAIAAEVRWLEDNRL